MTDSLPLEALRGWYDWLVEKGADVYIAKHRHQYRLYRAINLAHDVIELNYYKPNPDYEDETTATAERCNIFGVPGAVVDVPSERLCRGVRTKTDVDKLAVIKCFG